MSVHYKFKSALDYDTITFDGLHISVKDLKKSILHQKKIGKTNDFDLQVTNAQTKEVYTDDNVLIPKNTSLIIARIPVSQSQKKSWDFGSQPNASGAITVSNVRPSENEASADLSKMVGSEEDKIKAMISQSTLDYDPSNYQKVRGSNQTGEVPPNYRCYKCHMAGHWIKNCPMSSGPDSTDIKRSTGIPRSFMVDKPAGGYGQPAEKTPSPEPIRQTNIVEPKVDIPDDLQCMICKDLLTDAVMIPCCGSSFCDECIRMTLMESEDHECPDCKDKDISPVTLIPNRFLRNSVTAFKTETGYIKTRKYIPKTVQTAVETSPTTLTPGPVTVDVDITDNDKSVVILDSTVENKETSKEEESEIDTTVKDDDTKNDDAKNTVISEADSTQNGKVKESQKEAEPETESVKTEEKTVSEPEETPASEPAPETDRPPGVEMESDGDYEDNITVTMPPPHMQGRGALRNGRHLRPFLRPPGVETPPHQRGSNGSQVRVSPPAAVEDRAGTPTIDEKQPQRPNAVAPETQYNIPSMIEYPPQAGMPQVPVGAVPPHMMHGPPPVQGPPLVYGAPPPTGPVVPQDPYGPPPHVPPQGASYPPTGVPPYSAPPQQNRTDYPPHMNPYIPPPYDGRSMNPGMPPGYDRSRGGGSVGMYRGGPVPAGYPPMGGPRPINPMYAGAPRRIGGPEVVDKALEAFNRMMREKDEQARRREERERRREDRMRRTRSRSRSRSSSYSRGSSLLSRRSRSRSRSRSYARINYSRSRSRSRSPKMRKLSRSPMRRSRTPRRRTRTRSKSFSISRSRSFSRSMSPRGEYSPRRNHPRYRSPLRTPPRYIPHKDNHMRGSRRDFGPPHHHHHPPNDHYSQRSPGGHPPPSRGGGGDFYNQNDGPSGPPYHRHGGSRGGRGRGGYHHHNQNRPDYYNNDPGSMGQGYGRYNRDKRGSPSRSSYPPPLMSLKPSGPPMGTPNAPPMYNDPQRYENIPPIQQPAPYNVRPGRYDIREELPPPGTEQPPPPGFEPAPRYRDDGNRYQEPPVSDFRPTGYPGEDYRMVDHPEPAGPEYHEPSRESGRNRKDEPGRGDVTERKESSRHDNNKDTRDHHQSRSRHRVTPSPENRSRDRNPSSDRYKKRSGGAKEESSSNRHVTMTPKKERESSKKESEAKSSKKELISEEEKLKERKAKEEKREKKRKKKEAEKKKRKEEKKREKEEKSKSKKEAKDATLLGIAEFDPTKDSAPVDDVNKDDKVPTEKVEGVTEKPTDVSMESLDESKETQPAADQQEEEEEPGSSTPKPDLYGDILTEGGIDSKVVESYGKLSDTPKPLDTSKDSDKDGSFDGLEIQASEQDLKSEFDDNSPKKSISSTTVLANLPEPSKWELDDAETSTPGRGDAIKDDDVASPLDKTGGSTSKIVTNEVLKRAENAIFAKAINAIRPIEIKKISTDRAKLYSGITEKQEVAKDSADKKKSLTPDKKNLLQVTIPSDSSENRTVEMNDGSSSSQRKSIRTKITGPGSPPSRLSVRERLGGKVEEVAGPGIAPIVGVVKRSRTRTPPRIIIEPRKPSRERGGDAGGREKDRERERRDREERPGRHDRSGGGRLDSKVKTQDYQVSRPDRSREDAHRSSSTHRNRSSANDQHQHQRSRDRAAAQYSQQQQQQQHSQRERGSSRYEHHHQQQSSRPSSTRNDQQSLKRGHNQHQRSRRSKSNTSEERKRDKSSKRDKKHKREKEPVNITTVPSRKREDSSKNDPISKFINQEAPVRSREQEHTEKISKKVSTEGKKAALDEASFEPDYDETFETETDEMKKRVVPEEPKLKKRSRTPDSSSSSDDSSSDDSSSDSDSDRKKKNKKKKRKKRKASRRKSTSSDSETEEEGNEAKKKRKHKRNKQAKKKKKSKHK